MSNNLKLFQEGVLLFNKQEFFQAHEVWEELWKNEIDPDRNYIQGLIQAAGHFIHLLKKNYSGAERLGEKAKMKLQVVPLHEEYRVVDLKPLMTALEHNCAQFGVISGENAVPNFLVAQCPYSGYFAEIPFTYGSVAQLVRALHS